MSAVMVIFPFAGEVQEVASGEVDGAGGRRDRTGTGTKKPKEV